MIRNYRQIAKTGSQVVFIGIGKTQGRNQLADPKIYVNQMPRIPIKPIHRYIPPLPSISFTIERD